MNFKVSMTSSNSIVKGSKHLPTSLKLDLNMTKTEVIHLAIKNFSLYLSWDLPSHHATVANSAKICLADFQIIEKNWKK